MTGKELYEKYKGCKTKDGAIICGYGDFWVIGEVPPTCVSVMGWDDPLEEDIILDQPFNTGYFLYCKEADLDQNLLFNDIDVQILLVEGGKEPILGSEHAACFDLYAREVIKVNEGYFKVKLGIKTAIPVGYYAELDARSGITDTGWGVANSLGIIDSDYRGEWQIRFRRFANVNEMVFPYKVGDRCAQFMIKKKIPTRLVLVDELTKTVRGEGGHGHTGLN